MIEYITYKKKQYPIRLSYLALKKFKQETGKDFEKLDDNDIEIYETMLFYALESGGKAMDTPNPFKREIMEEILDECFFDFVKLVPKFFPAEVEALPGKTNRATRRKTTRTTKPKSRT